MLCEFWLPQPPSWGELSVAVQERDPRSTLAFFRRALSTRREMSGELDQRVRLPPAPPGVLVVERDPDLTCILNCGSRPVRLDRLAIQRAEPGRLLIASGEDERVAGGILPPDTTAWFR